MCKEATIHIGATRFKLNSGFVPEFMEMNPDLKLKEIKKEFPKDGVVPTKMDVYLEGGV